MCFCSTNWLSFCVSIFQLISSLPTYPPTNGNLTFSYPYLFHSRCFHKCTYLWRLVYYSLSLCKQLIVYFCVSIFQLISSLPTYPPRQHNSNYTYLYLFYCRCFHKRTYLWRLVYYSLSLCKQLIVYFCVSIFQLISSLPTYPPRQHNLTYTYLYQFHSRCFHKRTYLWQLVYYSLSLCKQLIVNFCVSIFQLISSLPTYPPTTVNLTYTYPYLFYCRCFHKRTYLWQLVYYSLSLCKQLIVNFCVSIFQLISSLPTYPPTTVNLTFTYPYLFYCRCFHKCTYLWRLVYYSLSLCKQLIVNFCVSIFQLISSLPTYPPTTVNLTYTYPYLFHSRCCSSRRWDFFPSVPP